MKTILIVDDDETMLNLTDAILSQTYETVCAASGEEAVKIFEKEEPDMILSDLLMPQMSGYELQQIIQEKSIRQIPFIFMTADERDESESLGFEQGAADYIRKPLKADLLLKRIERIFKHVEQVNGWKRVASTDAMTELLNKSASHEAIAQACREKQGTLMVIDLDSFKLVNDIYGHEMGDKVLIRFSKLIKSVIRNDDIAGRLGGDEFIAFCQHLHEEALIAKKTRDLNEGIVQAAKELMGEDMHIPLGASVGAVVIPDAGREFKDLFKKADAALYQVKKAGKHGYKIFEGENLPEKDESVYSFANLRTLFAERNTGHGAYVLDKDQFQVIYRFLMRFTTNYPWDIRMAVFSINAEKTEEVSDMVSHFCELAKQNLRTSDVILKHGANQVILLLMKVDEENVQIPIDRLLSKWDEQEHPGVSLTFESELLNITQ